jgi:hypothetical protein
LIAGRIMPKGLYARRVLKYSSAAGIIYVAARNPELLNSILSEAANALGLNPLLLQFAGWALLIFALMFPFVPLLSALLSIGMRILSTIKRVLQVLGRPMEKSEAKGGPQPTSA